MTYTLISQRMFITWCASTVWDPLQRQALCIISIVRPFQKSCNTGLISEVVFYNYRNVWEQSKLQNFSTPQLSLSHVFEFRSSQMITINCGCITFIIFFKQCHHEVLFTSGQLVSMPTTSVSAILRNRQQGIDYKNSSQNTFCRRSYYSNEV